MHTHSRFATTFAVLNRPIEAVHYVLAFAGPSVEVAPYRTYGSKELGKSCVSTLGDRNAVLLQNHGVIAVGCTAAKALNVAQSVEYTAELLWRALCIGTPTVLSDEEMARVAEEVCQLRPASQEHRGGRRRGLRAVACPSAVRG